MRRVLLNGGVALLCAMGCRADAPAGPPADGLLHLGTWGGDGAGVIVTDTLAHVHIGCTYGDIPARVLLDADGRFTVTGSYLLRAYPVVVGPTMPAQFSGRVSGSVLTMTVAVNDTINRQAVVLGPVRVWYRQEPKMSNCPICRTPGDRTTASPPFFTRIRRAISTYAAGFSSAHAAAVTRTAGASQTHAN